MTARNWGFRRSGHAGTLDPDATGLLIVLLGCATRLARFVSSETKRYSFGVRLGIVTDTDDTGGRVLRTSGPVEVREEAVAAALGSLTGTFLQRVPLYSAVRVGGERSYVAARAGKTPEMPSREVTVGGWRLESLDGCEVRLSATVSAGTYVRALARDLGDALGTGGAAFDIRRTEIGPFTLAEASSTPEDPVGLIGMLSLLRGMPVILLDGAGISRVAHGMPLDHPGTGHLALVDGSGRLLAVGEGRGDSVHPVCVLAGGAAC